MKLFRLALMALPLTGCVSTPDAAHTSTATSESRDIFVVRTTDKTPDAVLDAITAYAASKHWSNFGADKVRQGQVTLLKLCIREVGEQLWPIGLQLSAMLPCGNIGVYRRDGKTEISLLHPRYMQILHPDPAVEKASATAATLLIGMLDAIAP